MAKPGFVITVAGLGGLLVWSGVSNAGVLASIRDLLQGTPPVQGPAQFTAAAQSVQSAGGETLTPVAIGRGSGVAGSIVQYATAQVGKPYVYGGDGPEGYDCSGLCFEAYKSVGISIPRTTFVQILSGQGVPVSQAQPADLLFPNVGHVVMCIGGGQCVEARHTGTLIWTRPYKDSEFIQCRRFLA